MNPPSDLRDLAADVHRALRDRGVTVASAESLTGGELAALLSATPGASATYVGGVVAYATEVKRSVLGVTAERVISAECAEQLATGVRDRLGASWGVSTTGVAGPDGQEGRPVGTVYVGVAGPLGVSAYPLQLAGDRGTIRQDSCRQALELLLNSLTGRRDG